MESGHLQSILCVEDDPDIQVVSKMALEFVGNFVVRICSSGAEALQLVAAGYIPDLLLLDVMMPEMDGPDTLAKLRLLACTARTPVIFMTAKLHSSEINYYMTLGALGVIAKPFNPMQLANQVRQLWEEDKNEIRCADGK